MIYPEYCSYIATELCQWSVADLFGKNKYHETVESIRQRLGAVEILYQSVQGLSFLHGFGYIHRNLEPTNFWVAIYNENSSKPIYQIKIANFRYSKNINVLRENSGTKAEDWFAPESAIDGTVSDFSVDVFTTGMYFFYILFGECHPFAEETDVESNSTNSSTIFERFQEKGHRIYKWADANDENAMYDMPWIYKRLKTLYLSFWRDTAGFVESDTNFLNDALCLIRKMMKHDPLKRLVLKEIPEDGFFQPKSKKYYKIYAPGQKPGLCIIFCNYDFGKQQVSCY